MMKNVVHKQKHEIGSKILHEIVEEESNDIDQFNQAIKEIEFYLKEKYKIRKNLREK